MKRQHLATVLMLHSIGTSGLAQSSASVHEKVL